MKTLSVAALAAAACLTVRNVSAQENITGELFAGWAVNPLPASGGTTPVPPTTSDANLTIGPLTKGPGIGAVTTTGVFGGNTWTNAGFVGNESNSIRNGLYITYSVKANPGYTISFTTNVLFYHNSATGPFLGELQYSTDGINYSDIASLTYSAAGVSVTGGLTNNLSGVAALQNVSSSVTNFFRLVNWGATGTAGTWYINNASPVTMPDLQIIGNISSTGVAPFNLSVAPTSVTTNAGSTVTFTVTAQGDVSSNFWYKIVGSATNLIPGANSTTLTLPNVTGNDAAEYYAVLTNTTGDMKVVREEIFGPVVCAMPFDDPEEIVPVANDTNYGLAAGVWTNDVSKAHRVAAQLRAGTVWVNCYNIFDAALPFGGYKESGWGREMGHNAIDAYTETKSVCMKVA